MSEAWSNLSEDERLKWKDEAKQNAEKLRKEHPDCWKRKKYTKEAQWTSWYSCRRFREFCLDNNINVWNLSTDSLWLIRDRIFRRVFDRYSVKLVWPKKLFLVKESSQPSKCMKLNVTCTSAFPVTVFLCFIGRNENKRIN